MQFYIEHPSDDFCIFSKCSEKLSENQGFSGLDTLLELLSLSNLDRVTKNEFGCCRRSDMPPL